jgi:hypothetical protein
MMAAILEAQRSKRGVWSLGLDRVSAAERKKEKREQQGSYALAY